jgi:hypothetical protein
MPILGAYLCAYLALACLMGDGQGMGGDDLAVEPAPAAGSAIKGWPTEGGLT